MALLLMPYTNLHELNLDWIINALKESGVESVNGQSGVVVLYQDATVEFPAIPTDLNWTIQRKTNGTQVGIKFNKAAPLQRIYGNSTFAIYDEGNPPAYPVTSVNGSTGAVVIPIAFDSMSGDLLNISTVSPDHSWTINRKTRDGDIGLTLDSTGDNPSITLDYINNNETVDESIKILTEHSFGHVETTVPVSTAAGSYKVGTFTSLGIPSNAIITSVLCINATNSVCVATGISVSGQDIYVYLAEQVTTGDGQLRISYMIP